MQNDLESHDPFNWTYLMVALVTLLALPLMHVFFAWTIYFL